MISNIPIYRAKKIDSDEYVVGNYIKTQNKYYIYEDGTSDIYLDNEECFDDGSIDGEIRIIDLIFEIDATTLSIHFPDMLDSQGNKIFASLQEDGKGGDMVDLPDYLKAEKDTERIAVIVMKSFNEYKAFCKNGAIYGSGHFIGNSKVTGIQE